MEKEMLESSSPEDGSRKENSLLFEDELNMAQEAGNESMVIEDGELYGAYGHPEKRRMVSDLDGSFNAGQSILKSADDFLRGTSLLQQDLSKINELNSSKGINSVSSNLLSYVNQALKRNNFQVLNKPTLTIALQALEDVLRLYESRNIIGNNENTEQVFHSIYGKSSNPKSQNDMNLFNLISLYENKISSMQKETSALVNEIKQKKQLMAQIEDNMKQSHLRVVNELKTRLKDCEEKYVELKNNHQRAQQEIKKEKDPLSNFKLNEEAQINKSIIDEVCGVLGLKNPKLIVRSVKKLEQVLRAVPQLEKFIKDVCTIVFPELKEERFMHKYSQKMELVIPTLEETFAELEQLKNSKSSIRSPISNPHKEEDKKTNQKFFGIKKQFSFEEQAMQHFCYLFEISDDKNLIYETMNQILLFVQETRSFLKMSKSALGMKESASLNEVLLTLRCLIENQ